jgi:hypothetical protein
LSTRLPLALWVTLLSLGCGKEERHPPVYRPDAKSVLAPKTCAQVRGGEPSGDAVLIDGGAAGCAAEGMECPVSDVATFADACAKGMPVAVCSLSEWRLKCVQDAGVADAAGDSSSNAAGDASNDAGSADATSD